MNKSKKILSVFLAVIMTMLCVPVVAFAADVETLTYKNVETWPTVSYKNADGKMYYGQTLEQGLIINDNEVVRDAEGNQVEGYFVFSNPSKIPTAGTNVKDAIVFIPADTNIYAEFSVTKLRCKMYFNVETTTMIYDRDNDPVVASEIISGSVLSTATFTGGNVSNPYNPLEANIVAAEWGWLYPDTVITESGYHQAIMRPIGYEPIIEYIYVRIQGDTSPQSKLPISIEELPTVEEILYGTRLSDVTLTGGKVTIAGTTTKVNGSFKFAKDYILPIGTNKNVLITFVPDDKESYGEINGTVDVVVDYAPIKFTDNGGNEIIPTVEVPYGTKFDSYLANLIVEYVNINENIWIYFRDLNGNNYDYINTIPEIGTHTYKVTAVPYSSNSNYKATELEFKLAVEPREVSPYFTAYGNDEYEITTGDYKTKPKGTFDLYVNGELVMEDIAYQTRFTWRPEKSDIYTLKAVYNPIENDTFKVNDAMRVDMVLNLVWDINCVNSKANPCAYGEKAIVLHELGDKFAGWVVYDQNGNEFTPKNMVADTSTSSLTFTMPDFPVTVKALTTEDVTGGDNSDTSLLGWFQKLIKWIIDIVSNILNFWN